MRIDGFLPPLYNFPSSGGTERFSVPASAPSAPGVVVDISPEGQAAYEKSRGTEKIEASPETTGQCQTCKNRKYKDVSNDPSVSFQAPTNISPAAAPSAVASHEREHVANEQARADRDGRRVVSQTVTLESSICPECGRIYISGGVTRTLTAKDRSGDFPESSPRNGADKNNGILRIADGL